MFFYSVHQVPSPHFLLDQETASVNNLHWWVSPFNWFQSKVNKRQINSIVVKGCSHILSGPISLDIMTMLHVTCMYYTVCGIIQMFCRFFVRSSITCSNLFWESSLQKYKTTFHFKWTKKSCSIVVNCALFNPKLSKIIFEQIEARVLLAKLIQHYNFSLVPGQSLGYTVETTMKPVDGCQVYLTPASSNQQ